MNRTSRFVSEDTRLASLFCLNGSRDLFFLGCDIVTYTDLCYTPKKALLFFINYYKFFYNSITMQFINFYPFVFSCVFEKLLNTTVSKNNYLLSEKV